MITTDNLKLKLLGRLENFDTDTTMENLQKIDMAYGLTLNNITDTFDPTKPYQIKEYCIKDNVLYKFISTKEAGDWDDSVVVSTTVSNEMKEMNATITQLNSNKLEYKTYDNRNNETTINNHIRTQEVIEICCRYNLTPMFVLIMNPNGANELLLIYDIGKPYLTALKMTYYGAGNIGPQLILYRREKSKWCVPQVVNTTNATT